MLRLLPPERDRSISREASRELSREISTGRRIQADLNSLSDARRQLIATDAPRIRSLSTKRL